MTSPQPVSAPVTISSVVITLSPEPALRAAALTSLATQPGLELGEAAEAWVPAVLEADHAPTAIAALEAIPGVLLVEVVFVEVA
jgi:nitrate reductase NapAB chaperone NapD